MQVTESCLRKPQSQHLSRAPWAASPEPRALQREPASGLRAEREPASSFRRWALMSTGSTPSAESPGEQRPEQGRGSAGKFLRSGGRGKPVGGEAAAPAARSAPRTAPPPGAPGLCSGPPPFGASPHPAGGQACSRVTTARYSRRLSYPGDKQSGRVNPTTFTFSFP